MRCSNGWEGGDFVIYVQGDGNSALLWRVAGVALSLAAVRVIVHAFAHPESLRSGVVLTAIVFAILGAVPLFLAAETQAARSELRVGPETLTFVHRVFFLRRRRVCPRDQLERIGYIPAMKDTLPALGVMIRSRMMPFRFGRGLTPEQAGDILAALKGSGTWIVSTPMDLTTSLYG